VWKHQPDSFFATPAVIDVDASIMPMGAETKEGMDISYYGIWGYLLGFASDRAHKAPSVWSSKMSTPRSWLHF